MEDRFLTTGPSGKSFLFSFPACSPITLWQIEGEKVEAVTDFIFLNYKITGDSDCSHEIKTLSPWKEIYDQSRQCIKKQRHHFTNKAPQRQSYAFFFFSQ